jgi:hypothetical protein
MHHRIVRHLVSLGSAGGLRPIAEARPFAAGHDRIDILFRDLPQGPRPATAIDVAVTFPLKVSSVRHAAAAQGGAATFYEKSKVARYGAQAAAANVAFIPAVVDTFGAWGASAHPLLASLAQRSAARLGRDPSRAKTEVLRQLSVILARGVSTLLLANAGEAVLNA